MKLRVTMYGESILEEATKPVTCFDRELAELADNMVETMYEEEGVGLAAPQVNRRERLCVVDVSGLPGEELEYELDGRRPPIDLIMPLVLVNPEVSVSGGAAILGEEGCLSFPGIRGEVPRSPGVSVRYADLQGQEHQLRCSGWFARVVQHEVDHLDGILFIERMEARSWRYVEGRVKRLKKQVRRERKRARESGA